MTLPMSRIRAVFAAVVLGLTVSACGYNTIPTYEEQAKAKWADVQNNYQRRADLIPNLVATVQGYARQEKDVLTAVVEARANSPVLGLASELMGEIVAVKAAEGHAESPVVGQHARIAIE